MHLSPHDKFYKNCNCICCWSMDQNINSVFKLCFQRIMSPNGNFVFVFCLVFLFVCLFVGFFGFFYQNILSQINFILKMTRKSRCEIFSCQAGGCSVIRDVDLCLSLLFAHAFACREPLMLWPHKWHIFPGWKHQAGGGWTDSILSRNTAVATHNETSVL